MPRSEDQQRIDAELAKLEEQLRNLASNQPRDDAFALYEWGQQMQRLSERVKGLRSQQQRADEREVQDQQSEYADRLDPFAERTPEEQAAYERAIGMVDQSELGLYGSPYSREVGENELVDAQSIDPALWDSSWRGAESNFGDLEYSADALDRMGEGRDYFGAIFKGGGRDAVSEAEYGRRVADAEQRRRAQTEAALAAEEARGGSSAGQRVLAEQAASAGQISDTYRAGLDANAMAQGRRDAAAGKYYDLSKGIGDTEFGADFDKAGALDAFDVSKNQALDYQTSQNAAATQQANVYNADSASSADRYNASRYTDAADMNTQRDWYTSDLNTDTRNQNVRGNAQARAAATGAYGGALGMEGNQTLGQGDLNLARAQFQFNKSQAPTSLERGLQAAVPFVGAGAGVLSNIYRSPSRRENR